MKLFDHIPKREALRNWRTGAQISQAEMANLMGVPLRTYEDLEGGRSPIRPIHINAAVFAMIQHAAENRGCLDLPEEVVNVVLRASERRA